MNDGPADADVVSSKSAQSVTTFFLSVAAIAILAGLMVGLGAVLGIAIGAQDRVGGTKVPFGIVGMLVLSIPVIWLVPLNWRRRYLAMLPLMWLIVGGSLVAHLFVSGDHWIFAVIPAIAIAIGLPVGELIMKRQQAGY